MSMVGNDLVAAVQARGSDAKDIRDAAHEACHALVWGVTKRWTRNNIHAKRPKGARGRSQGVFDEITARAVEAITCARLAIPYDVKHWAGIAWLETFQNERLSLPLSPWLENAIRARMQTKLAQDLSNDVLHLVSIPFERKTRGRKTKTIS